MAAAAVLRATGETPSLQSVSPGAAVGWCIGLAEVTEEEELPYVPVILHSFTVWRYVTFFFCFGMQEAIGSCYRLMQQLVIGGNVQTRAAGTTASPVNLWCSDEALSSSHSSSSSSPPPAKRRKRSPPGI